ncbi:hypothetical protein [Haloferula sp. BvORR071]|uniref:hypothetical protein n=1 Tax=Haloferula sp. BvORR071 TaxID=1396141 RepID=UPI00054D4397|nr:hypothetical protein [Haloferula sp. BvORR071]
MKITKVCCQGCGADLEVDESVRYVTCNYCHARLEVVHDTSVTHTRILEKLEKNTERMAGNLRVIELQNDLERLDREWASRKDSFMVRGQHGHRHMPSTGGSVAGGIFAIVGGIVWMSFAARIGAPMPFPLFGLLFIGFAIFSMVNGASKASSYESEGRDFEQRRNSLIRQIERERRD